MSLWLISRRRAVSEQFTGVAPPDRLAVNRCSVSTLHARRVRQDLPQIKVCAVSMAVSIRSSLRQGFCESSTNYRRAQVRLSLERAASVPATSAVFQPSHEKFSALWTIRTAGAGHFFPRSAKRRPSASMGGATISIPRSSRLPRRQGSRSPMTGTIQTRRSRARFLAGKTGFDVDRPRASPAKANPGEDAKTRQSQTSNSRTFGGGDGAPCSL